MYLPTFNQWMGIYDLDNYSGWHKSEIKFETVRWF